jgi:hypothetical protein
MESEHIYKYVGLFVIVIFLLYVVVSTLTFQFNVMEGMTSEKKSANDTDKDKVPEAIKSNTSRVEDALLIDKYLKSYEDTIIDLDTNIDMYLLGQVINNAESISANPGSDENQKLVTKLNNLKTFKESLNHAIKVLDKK